MHRPKTAVILAAGRGSRLNIKGLAKPLVPFLGIPLIERSIRGFLSFGIRNFIVVTGCNAKGVRAFLEQLEGKIGGINILCIFNRDWEAGNGTSFLTVSGCGLKEDFILSMCDHVFSQDLIGKILRSRPSKRGMCLLVDRRLHNPVIDRDDATKVILEMDNIKRIGKDLDDYDGYDTGLFVCSGEIFEDLKGFHGKAPITLSQIVEYLAKKGRVKGACIEKGFWADLDDKSAFDRAEKAFLKLLRGKGRDGPISRLLNRPISIRLTRLLINTPLTPNQISLTSFFMALAAAFFLTRGSYVWFAAGGIMAQMASIVDGCDGEIARIKWQQSSYGAWLDAVLDRYADAFLIAGITWHVANYRVVGNWGWVLGIMALIGSFLNSYTADKYDKWMEKQKKVQKIRIGRDVRMFLIFLFGIFYRPVELLIMLASLMHTENIRRMWRLRTA